MINKAPRPSAQAGDRRYGSAGSSGWSGVEEGVELPMTRELMTRVAVEGSALLLALLLIAAIAVG